MRYQLRFSLSLYHGITLKQRHYIIKRVIHCTRFQYTKKVIDIRHKYSYNSKCLNYNYLYDKRRS